MYVVMLLLKVWGVFTAILVVLLIYRHILTLHEDDQLFLGDSEAHLQKEQQVLQTRLTKLSPIVYVFAATSGGLFLLIAGLWIWRGIA